MMNSHIKVATRDMEYWFFVIYLKQLFRSKVLIFYLNHQLYSKTHIEYKQ